MVLKRLPRFIGWPTGIREVPQRPHVYSAPGSPKSLPTPSSIIHNTQPCEEKEMSQSFSHNINSLNSYTSINLSNNFIAADDRSNILAWLSPLDPRSRHQDIQERRVEIIGEWLLRTKEFRSWHAGSKGDGSDN